MNEPVEAESADEVYEHVPWAQLIEPVTRSHSWLVYLAAGAIAVAGLGAFIGRSMSRPAPDAPAPTAEQVTPATEPAVTVPSTTFPPPEIDLLSEADLMAAVPAAADQQAATRAEWFVVDYFSSGGDPGGSPAVVEALPAEALAGMPEGAGVSFVEWAATAQVEALTDSRYRSRVLFRMLGAREDGTYARLPVRAVDVIVEVDAEGRAAVVDLPMPVQLPEPAAADEWEFRESEPPDRMRAAALEIAAEWGGETEVIQAGSAGDLWRVVVRVADQVGNAWPMVVWLTADGVPDSPAG